MILLVRQELLKLSRRFTPYVVYLAIAALITLIVLGFYYSPPPWLTGERTNRGLDGFEVVGTPLNGLMICQFVMRTLALLLPYLAPVVAGEILGAEGGTGTLRTMLVRPRSRSAIYWAKFLTAAIYTLSLSAATMLTSLALGAAFFGTGKLWEMEALIHRRVVVLSVGEGLYWLAIGHLLLAVAVFATASLGFALGAFVDNGLVPGFAALGLTITLLIGSQFEFTWIEQVKPYLFTEYLAASTRVVPVEFDAATGALVAPTAEILKVLRVCGAYIAAFAVMGWWRFCRRDVTC